MKKSKNVLALTSWSYRDALIQTYTMPYIRMIKKNIPASSRVYLVTAEQKRLKVLSEDKKRIKQELKAEGIIWVDYDFFRFGPKAFIEQLIQLIRLWYICIVKKIDYIQTWCSPAGVIGYILSVLTGKPLILDSFEPHAEPSVENGDWPPYGIAFRILFYFEKKQAQHAKVVIATSRILKNYSKERWGIELNNFFVKPALIDLEKFNFNLRKDSVILKKYGIENKIVCVYAGKIGGIYLEQEIFDFIKVCHDFWGNKFCFLMLTDARDDQINLLCYKAKLDRNVVLSRYVEHNEIHRYIGAGDFAINPIKIIKSKKCCTSIKDGEYWAMGLPIVITNSIADDVNIIRELELGSVLYELNKEAYLAAVMEIDGLMKKYSSRQLYDKIRPVAEQYRNYDIAEKIYSRIYADGEITVPEG